MTPPRPCAACGVKPIAYGGRKFCYDCVPRVWKRPARCKRCGSDTDYYTAGFCRRCHRLAPLTDSCLDCLAWGVTRHNKWLCQACRGWRRNYAVEECPSCRRNVVVNDRGFCRLCSRQATVAEQRQRLLRRSHHHRIDVMKANCGGQQLFFADQILKKRNVRKDIAPPHPVSRPRAWPVAYPVTHRQLVLFEASRDLNLTYSRGLPTPPLPELVAALDRAVQDHACQHGWSEGLRDLTFRGIRVLLATQDTPGAPIKASEAATLGQLSWATVRPVLEVLAATGMLDDDRAAPLEAFFATQAAGLAAPMATEFRQWFEVLRDGTATPPRTRPRSIETVRHRIAAVSEALHVWTDTGHESLREITRQDILDVLPTVAYRRRQVLDSLRSLFRFLKARKVIFANPVARLRSERVQLNHPLPMDISDVREAINSTDPARAALAALIAFHAPRNSQLRTLQLTDVRDGRMLLGETTIILAAPVRDRLTAWLDQRTHRWPNSINPHLFINFYTAVRTCPVSRTWISETLGMSAQAIREDRILHEALATGGDVRRLCDLFGLTVGGAERYAHTTDQPGADNDNTLSL